MSHDQDEAQSHGEHGRVPKQARRVRRHSRPQSDGQRIGDERVVDRAQKEDGAEKESEFPVVLFAERAGEQDIEQEVAAAHNALIDKRP